MYSAIMGEEKEIVEKNESKAVSEKTKKNITVLGQETEFDGDGNPVSETYYNHEEINWALYYENEYDENGKIIRISVYRQDGPDGSKVLESHILNYYDSYGNLIKSENYDAFDVDDFLFYTDEYEYTILEH